VNFYDNALEVHQSAEILYKNEHYRMSVSTSCLAMELYLKSKLYLTEKGEDYAYGHDAINMYRELANRFGFDKWLFEIVKLSRKYFNESRYPHGDTAIYTKAFAQEFLGYVADIKDFIDNECIATVDDLKDKYRK